MAVPAPMVSVVVATGPEDEGLATCLASLARLEYPPERHEIIVVSVSERDGIALPPGGRARYVRTTEERIPSARNAGIASASGSLVAFTDPDCTVATNWLKELVEPFVDERIGAVAGAIVPAPPASDAERYAARRLSHSQLRPLSHSAWRFAMTPNLAFRRDPLVDAGMFDTSFPGGGWEDADLCWRFARATGLELAYAPRAVVFHRYRATAREFLVQHYRYGYGLGLVSSKHAAELGTAWLKRTLRYDSLPRVARSWLGAELRRLGGRQVELVTPRFDLLRLLGQRAGVLRARLRGP
jgi:GT2 family glycosyltransferase